MSDDILSRLYCSYEKAGWPCESCTFCAARTEIERLRRWKAEATTVLVEWDAVWECAGKGILGESKQRGVVAELGRLDDEIERLRAVVDALVDRPFRGTSEERRFRLYGSDWSAVHDALDKWEEARRG